jgi:hypothetical protein
MATLRRSRTSSFLSALALGTILLTSLLPGLALGAPLVAITRPTQGATVSGQIWIDVAFSSDSNLPITRLEVYIDDRLAREHDLAQPMLMGRQTFNWDFSYAAASVHRIGARAIDAGNNAAVASITVQVQSAAVTGPDVIPPQIRIYYPAQGAPLHGTVEIKADAQDNVGVELVYFYIDGRLHKMMMNAPPYVDAWDTTRDVDGPHVLEAVAVDRAENEARSAQVTVIVENSNRTTGPAPGGTMNPQGYTPSPLPAVPTPAPIMPTPAPLPTTPPTPTPPTPPTPPAPLTPTPAPAPIIGAGGPALPAPSPEQSGLSGTPAPTPVAVPPPAPAPSPKIVEIIPKAPIPVVPVAPNVTPFRWDSPSGPVALSGARASAVVSSGGHLMAPVAPPTGLTRPAAAGAGAPTATGDPAAAQKATGPSGVLSTTAPSIASTTSAPAAHPAGPVTIASQPGSAAPVLPKAPATTTVGPVTPIATGTTPRLATTGMPPAAAKAPAPEGQLRTSIAGRTSTPAVAASSGLTTVTPVKPAHSAGLAPLLPRPLPRNTSRVQPVGAPVPAYSSEPIPVQPALTITPDRKPTPGAGLARVTAPTLTPMKAPPAPAKSATPPAPAKATTPPALAKATTPPARPQVVSVVKPPLTPAMLSDVALAEYRGLPIPASRMLARLPETGATSASADSRITPPQGDLAAVPVATATLRDIKIVFDGEVLSLRATPETKAGISLAPLREIFEQTDGVLYWFPVEKKVQAVNSSVDMTLTIGDPKATVNGEEKVLVVAPYIKHGRTMVPLQFIADVLDVNIAVNNATGQIIISSNQF